MVNNQNSSNGQHIGYVRVSSVGQNTDRQLAGMELDKVFEEKVSAATTNRMELKACLTFLREGDTLHVHSMDRLARNLGDMIKIVDDLIERGVVVRFEKENLNFSGDQKNPMSRLILHVMSAIGEFERALIQERQLEGIAAAKAAGKHLGRPRTVTDKVAAEIRDFITAGEKKTVVAKRFGVTRQTIYRLLKKSA